VVTGGIQTGTVRQATLLPFAEQQQQALRDVYVTDGNLANLSDGLGSTLGAAYLARAHYIDRERFTSISNNVANVIAYALAVTSRDANSAKHLIANGTTNGTKPAVAEAVAVIKDPGGTFDVFGRAYGHPAGSAGADIHGNSRPFQTEVSILSIVGPDYLNVPADNTVYNRGPLMDLSNSPSYPSGHTAYGYTGALVLAILVPARYQQMIARGAEYGNDRIIVGAHYAMDVIGGRTVALYDMAHLLANDPAYVGRSFRDAPHIEDFQTAIKEARKDVIAVVQTSCGNRVEVCALEDTGRLSNPAANQAFYDATQTYNLPVVYPQNAQAVEDIGKLAPEAGYLLTVAFPALSLKQADQILTETEGAGGGFLDDGSAFGVYSRINLYAAAGRAAQVSAGK
jgi:hypothetical protein